MSLLFLLASIGVVNGLLLGIYFIFKKKRRLVEIYFGGMLLSLSLRIGKSVFFYFDRDTDRLILQLGLSACVFIGPFFYLYLKSLFKQSSITSNKDTGLLAIILLLITSVGIVYPYRVYPDIWNQFIIYGIYGIWISFVMLAILQHRKWVINLLSFTSKPKGKELFLMAIIIGVVFITLLYQFALFVRGFTYIWGAIVFSISFYILMIRAITNRKQIIPLSIVPGAVTENSQILTQLDAAMLEKKPYLSQGLKLEDLAHIAGVSKHTLSRVLNEEYSHGFAHYVSTYRVNEAKQLIATRPELSLEGIGYESGFKSKSAFFDTFKKITNNTPSSYKKSIANHTTLK